MHRFSFLGTFAALPGLYSNGLGAISPLVGFEGRRQVRCYFHLVNSHDAIFDDTGIDVADIEAARIEAMKAIQEIREEDSEADQDWWGWQLKVTDQSGHTLLSIPLNSPSQQYLPMQSWRIALSS